MINSLLLSVPCGTSYEDLKRPFKFSEDHMGASNWVMRFPFVIFSSDFTQKHTFNEEEVTVETSKENPNESKWKYFIITKSDGQRLYCTAQTYYVQNKQRQQKGPLKCRNDSSFGFSTEHECYKQFYLPKCLILYSQMPYFKLQLNLMKIYFELHMPEPGFSYSVNQDHYYTYRELLQTGCQQDWEHKILERTHKPKRIPCSIEFVFNYYLEASNQHKSGQSMLIEKETGRGVLHLYKLKTSSIYQIYYIFHLPFSKEVIRRILSAILQQKQIIFTGQSSNLITLIIETCMQMILPLHWCFMCVPDLPLHLIQAVQQSFMPFIVGIHESHLSKIELKDKVVVYVDKNKIQCKAGLPLCHCNLESYFNYNQTAEGMYLQWEKEVRIKSLLFISILLEEPLQLRSDYLESFIRSRGSDQYFYRQFLVNSMMFKKLKEDREDNARRELLQLFLVPRHDRKQYLLNKFNYLVTQTKLPRLEDNEKNWIRYYDKMTHLRHTMKKSRLCRQSLHIRKLPAQSFSHNSFVSSSNVSVGRSSIITQSSIRL